MSEAETIEIAGPGLAAAVSPLGAELQWLRDADGRDLLWDGDPAWWTGRAPILFPVIGVVNEGVVRVDGQAYPMPKHGFARRRTWGVAARSAADVTFRLEADAETRASYPFDFRLDLRFAIDDATLAVTATLANAGDRPMPASFGFHPALRWPLPFGQPREAHRIRFAMAEPAPIRRIDGDGLLRPTPQPSPVEGDMLRPRDDLFVDDALIWDAVAARSLVYGAPGAPSIRIDYPDMPQLGIWTKPGAPYLCIEPWAGMADPQGFTGELADKPGIVIVAPGDTRTFAMSLTLVAPA